LPEFVWWRVRQGVTGQCPDSVPRSFPMSFPQSSQAPCAPKPGALAGERHATMHALFGDGCDMQGRK